MKKSMWLYNFLTAILKWISKPLFFTTTTGRENENVEGPVVYAVNHMSNWDPVIVALETKKPINFMAKKELFGVPVLKTILKWLGAFPIDRTGNDLVTLKMTINALKDGARICLFPQGTRCPDVEPSTTEVKGGTALLVKHTKATVIPIGIYTKNYRVKLFRKIYVTIGTPMKFEDLGFAGGREEYDRVTKKIFDEIVMLCDKSKEKANAK
jgi:1-acyl-sn-glycerol-3-phosphate acyltransferase